MTELTIGQVLAIGLLAIMADLGLAMAFSLLIRGGKPYQDRHDW
jgi:hypothetical protein